MIDTDFSVFTLQRVSGVVAKTPRKEREDKIGRMLSSAAPALEELETRSGILRRAHAGLMDEWRAGQRGHRRGLFDMSVEDPLLEKFRFSADGMNFIRVAHEVCEATRAATESYVKAAKAVRIPELIPVSAGADIFSASGDALQKMHMVHQINGPAMRSYISGLVRAASLPSEIADVAQSIARTLSDYHRALCKRHSVDGVRIHGNALLTDVAMHVFENIDSDGEISEAEGADALSVYSSRKARIMADAIQDPFVNELLTSEGGFVSFVVDSVQGLYDCAVQLRELLLPEIRDVHEAMYADTPNTGKSASKVLGALEEIKLLDPSSVPYRDRNVLLSQEEIVSMEFKNETLRTIVDLYRASASSEDVIAYVVGRKAQLRRFYRDENSFYVCKIGSGNPLFGEAPGDLQIVPGKRPTATFDDIVGSGFAELKDFHRTIRGSASWTDIFCATSPSRSADKSNVLLIGPQGCGKTEALRAVASERDSIGIFASSSDFLTCWKGETMKNPKRLFEQALKLQKESRKHVHILLDEVDAVLRKREYLGHGEDDLTTEFQNLMDGIVHYPNLTVWAATNHPERIPMPMIRRFSKVLIVGELTEEDRVRLLKSFLSYLPLSGFGEADWKHSAERMEGATGDVVRKVADHVWRTTMQAFVDEKPEEARRLIAWLNREKRFSVSDFSPKEREEFKSMLGQHFSVEPRHLRDSVDSHMKNIAIRTEISAARESYENARAVVAQLSGGIIVV